MSRSRVEPRKCVICGKPQDEHVRPFCSRRCADVDLSRWLNGRYSIPAMAGDGGAYLDGEPGPADDDY